MRDLSKEYAGLSFAISVTEPKFFPLIQEILKEEIVPVSLVSHEKNKELIENSFLALAKSGTITLELALYGLPTVVTYAISSVDTFLAKYIFRIHLPYYCLVNIIAKKSVFPELIGPALTKKSLTTNLKKMITNSELLSNCHQECLDLRKILGHQASSTEAAKNILNLLV
jgi:lipid-A-disaccharide synthase